MKKFLIVDGNSILNRAFYGLAGARMTTADGLHTNAIFGFLNIYYMIVEKFEPDYVAVAFDLHAPTFRHKMYKEYKGTRKGMPDELKEQVPVIKEVLKAMNIHIFELEGYEADDILGTIASLNEKNEIFTYILTGDRDSYQLISSTTNIIYPSNKGSKTDYTVYTPELLKEEKGIEPYQVVDIKSLMGDSSDNIPGVKGIGEKTAYSLIYKYTTMENIYKNIDNLDASLKVIEKLKNDEEMAKLSYTLATINREVPVELNYDDVIVKDVNKEELYKLFKKLSFNKFLSKYDFSTVSKEAEKESVKESNLSISKDNVIVITRDNYNSLNDEIKKLFELDSLSYILNLDTGANPEDLDFYDNNLPCNNYSYVSMYNSNIDKCYIFNLKELDEKDVDYILKSIAENKVNKYGFNIKQDMRFFMTKYEAQISNFTYDLNLACYLLDSNRSYKFEAVLGELFGIILDFENNEEKDKQLSLFETMEDGNKSDIDENTSIQIALATKGIYLSKEIMDKKIADVNMTSLLYDIEVPLSLTLASMEKEGMYVDKDKLDDFDIQISKRINELEEDIYKYAGEEFNINSSQQLGRILFEKLELPTKKKTKTGYSTNKDVLEALEDYHPIIPLLIEYRQVIKLKTTYVDGLREKIKDDSRIHTTFTQTVTSTGRLSSIEPNLQNIPVRLELGSKIRTFFTAPNGKKIVDADYSQIELRVLSHISKDKVMQQAFNDGIDVHKVTASQVFNVDINDVTKKMRSKAKAVNFGIVYGISEFGLAKNIGVSWKEAKEYINTYLEKYSGIHKFMQDIVKEAKEDGYVTTMFNRRRYIPELNSKNKNMVQFGERVAMNTPIQGSAADIIKIAMNKLYKLIKENNLKSRLVMQVHDELIVETYDDEVEIISKLMKEAMENVVKLDIPLVVDLNVGNSWYEAK